MYKRTTNYTNETNLIEFKDASVLNGYELARL